MHFRKRGCGVGLLERLELLSRRRLLLPEALLEARVRRALRLRELCELLRRRLALPGEERLGRGANSGTLFTTK